MRQKKAADIYKNIEAALALFWSRVLDRTERIPMKGMVIGMAALLILSLIPLLLLGNYSVMCIDDYDYGRRVHDTFMETGSLWQSVRTAWSQNMEFYKNWQGTYISCFLMALCPMNFWYDTAYLVPVLMIGMAVVSTYVLGKHILTKWLSFDRMSAAFVMLALLFMFYQVIEAPFEGIYWYNGATHYILMQSVWMFMLTLVLKGIQAGQKSAQALCCVFAALLAAIVGGGNLITALQMEIVMTALTVYVLAANRRKILSVCIPFAVGSAGFLVNVLAAGNAVRDKVDATEGYGAVKSILLSFYNAVVFIIGWTPAFVILVWLALLPVLWKAAKRSERTFSHPVRVTLFAYCLISAMFTPTFFAVGMAGLSRVDNIIQLAYYICLIIVTAYWLGYFSHRHKKADDAGEAFGDFLEKAGKKMTVFGLLLVLVVWVFTANKNTYTSVSALRSLINGDAKTYYAEAMERYGQYIDEEITDVVVEPFSARPALFDFEDLSVDPQNWLNGAVAGYYHKTSVRRAAE